MEMEEDGVRAAAAAAAAAAAEEDAEEDVEEEEEVQCVDARRWLCRRDGRRPSMGMERRSGGCGGARGAFSCA